MLYSSLACYTLPRVCNTFEESEFNKEPVLYPTLDGVVTHRLCNKLVLASTQTCQCIQMAVARYML